MEKHVISWVCALAVLTGCTSMYVGPRMGFDVPITDSANASTGVTGGIWAGIHVTDRLTVEFAPGLGTQEIVRNQSESYSSNGVDVFQTSYQKSSISFVDLPLNVRYAFAERSASVIPFVSAGITYQSLRSRRHLINGTSTIADVQWPFYDENPQSTSTGGTSIALSMAGGVEYPLSKTWHVRGEASLLIRARRFTSGAGIVLVGYDAFDNQVYYNFSTRFPATSIGFSVGIVGYF